MSLTAGRFISGGNNMADNYLEKKMEEYERKKAEYERKKGGRK